METKVPAFVIPGIYQHYKGPKYMVMGVARHANTEERGVVYMPLEPHGKEVPMLCYRPVDGEDGFFTPTEKGEERFKFLYPMNSTEIERPTID